VFCDGCGGETCVKDSRTTDNIIRRRRECLRCGARFSTFEVRDALYSVLRHHQRAVAKVQEARVALNVVIDIIENDLPIELRGKLTA
jgi:transcriptional repressor NrdR